MSKDTETTPDRGRSAEVARYASGWRKEPPDRPGWWWRQVSNEYEGPRVYEITPRLLRERLWHPSGWWAGPLEPPPPPDDSHNARSAGARDNNQPNETDGHSTK